MDGCEDGLVGVRWVGNADLKSLEGLQPQISPERRDGSKPVIIDRETLQ